jgi:hypothetical protein
MALLRRGLFVSNHRLSDSQTDGAACADSTMVNMAIKVDPNGVRGNRALSLELSYADTKGDAHERRR